MKKKLLLSLLGVLIALPIFAQDFTYKYQGNTLSYKIIDENAKTCMIKEGNGNIAGPLIIPETAKYGENEYTVISIGYNAFYGSTRMISVTIPNSVKTIGSYAFLGCSSLTSVTISNSVTEIGNEAFYGCGLNEVKLLDGDEAIELGSDVFKNVYSLKSLYIGRPLKRQIFPVSNLGTLIMGNTIKEIGSDIWNNITNLRSLTLGSSLTSIGENAFSGCTALSEVVVPPSVETIGASAFAGNSNLASIIMGHNVKTIGEKAFDGCKASTVSITAQPPPDIPQQHV